MGHKGNLNQAVANLKHNTCFLILMLNIKLEKNWVGFNERFKLRKLSTFRQTMPPLTIKITLCFKILS